MDSRFWVVDLDPANVPEHALAHFAFPDTVGIVDEEQGGIIAYCDRALSRGIVEALEANNGDY